MKIILVGYGKMGREIEKIAIEKGHTIILKIDKISGIADKTTIEVDDLKKADVIIEFALPNDIVENCKKYSESEVPVIIATTGWQNKRDEIKQLFEKKGCGLWGNNFSIGAHILFKLTEKITKLISCVPSYDIMIHEYHHKHKKDSPSGTSLTIAEKIIQNSDKKNEIVTGDINGEIKDNQLHISASRGGYFPGTHTVSIDSESDTIEIKHTARNKTIFALGAVLAAEWIIGKKGFYRVENFIDDILK